MVFKSVQVELDGGNSSVQTREDISLALHKIADRIASGEDSFYVRDIIDGKWQIVGDVIIRWETA